MEKDMDDGWINGTSALRGIVESGMGKSLDFNIIRLQIAAFLRKKGCYCLGTDRVHGREKIILVSYRDESGQIQTESISELPSYTRSRPVNTW